MDRATTVRSLLGALTGALFFGSVSVYRSLVADGGLLDYVQPVAVMVVIGATVGGLVGPLVGQAWSRTRDRRSEQPAGSQPLWMMLGVGALVGYGIGTAWQRPWVGVALGLLLATASRMIFR